MSSPPKRVVVPRGGLSPQVLVSRLGELAAGKTKPHKTAASRTSGDSVLGRGGALTLSPRGIVPDNAPHSTSPKKQTNNAPSFIRRQDPPSASTLLPLFEPQDPPLPVLNDSNLGESKATSTVHLDTSKAMTKRGSEL